MAAQTAPNLGLNFGWTLGESGWNIGMDKNMQILDAVAWGLRVINMTTTEPPENPAQGDAYIIAADATGDWLDKTAQAAILLSGAWVYLIPQLLARVMDLATSKEYIYKSTGWEVYNAGGGGGGLEMATNEEAEAGTNTTKAVNPYQLANYGIPGPAGEDGADGSDGADGQDGFSPTVAVKTSTSDTYVLTVTDKNGSYDTPNLKGGGSGGGGVDFVVETAWDGVNLKGYTKWESGKLEQWVYIANPSAGANNIVVFPVPFIDLNYAWARGNQSTGTGNVPYRETGLYTTDRGITQCGIWVGTSMSSPLSATFIGRWK